MDDDTEADDRTLMALPRTLRPVVGGLCLALVLFHVLTAGFGQYAPLIQRPLHVGLGLAIVFLSLCQLADPHGSRLNLWLGRAFNVAATLFGLLAAGYIVMEETRLTESFGIIAQPHEFVLAIGLTLLAMEAARRTTGWALPILATCAILYTMFGDLVPGYWGHTGFDVYYVVEHLYLSGEGIWGTVTGLSATLIAIFIIFGAFLLSTGAARSFMEIALLVAGRFPGGGAKVAAVSSAFFGMLNGAAVANVATTGNFTIPAMKRLGYRPTFAAAVEATASSGGQITPPIMGAGAFVMAELLGVPYLDVVYAAIIPALLFFICVWVSVDVEARRENMKPFDASEIPPAREVLAPRRIGPVLLTLVVTLGAMFYGYTPTLAAFYGICTNIVVFLVNGSMTRAALAERLKALWSGAQAAARSISSILPLLIAAQITLSLIGLTGVGIKLGEAIVGFGGSDTLLLSVVLAMGVALILGMGMPTTAAYLLAAAVAAPALISLGVEPMVAHFFVFYSALLSALTPPVCTAVFTAAVIARAPWWPICVASMRLAAMKYVLPFFFVFRPSVLLKGTWAEIAWTLFMGIVASMLIAVGMGRFYRRAIGLPLAAVLVVAGALVVSGWWVTDVLALVLAGAVVVTHRLMPGPKKDEVAMADTPPSSRSSDGAGA